MAEGVRFDRDAVCIAIVAVLLALPLWCVRAPPMPDYPAHLASYYLIATGAKAPGVAGFYSIHWAFIPNLAGEIIVPLLSHAMELEIAAKLFITAGVAMWVIGPALVHRALYGRIGMAPLFAAMFAYNANFTWGFLNYYFAMGAAFVALAVWIGAEGRRNALYLTAFAVAVTAIYFAHLFAAATLLLVLGCYEIGGLLRAPSWRETVRRGVTVILPFVPALLAYLFLRPPAVPGGGFAFHILDRAQDRVEAALQLSYDNPSFVLLALLTILFVAGLWRGWISVHRRMIVPLVVLALAAGFAPEWAMGGWGVDLRLPAVLCSLAFASIAVDLDQSSRRLLAAAASLVLVCNAVILTRNWLSYDKGISEFRDEARSLKPGLKLLTVLDGDSIGFRSDQPYWHMAEYAIIDPGAFTPLLFTTRDQHIVQLDAAYQPIAAASAEQGSPPDIDELNDLAARQIDDDEDIRNVFPYLMGFQCRYDVAVVVHLDGPRAAVPPMLRLRSAGRIFSLYDILPDASCRKS